MESVAVPVIKRALCMKRADAPTFLHKASQLTLHAIDFDFFDVPVELVDRAICEKDESTLQFIPYIVVQDQCGNVLCYLRGGEGEEARLHGNISIGIGGHVDIHPDHHDLSLYQVLQNEAAREMEEEIGVIPSRPLQFAHVIIDPTNDVGRVHLGLLAIYTMSESDKLVYEVGAIDNAMFVHRRELLAPHNFNRLENWSKAVVGYLTADDTVFHHPV